MQVAGSKGKGQGSPNGLVVLQDPQFCRWLPTQGQTFAP